MYFCENYLYKNCEYPFKINSTFKLIIKTEFL